MKSKILILDVSKNITNVAKTELTILYHCRCNPNFHLRAILLYYWTYFRTLSESVQTAYEKFW